MSSKATICVAVAVLAMAGCGGGGTLSKKELQTQAGSVESFAAEGALVAQSVEEGRATDTYVRVHTEYLGKAAAKIDATLASAHANGSLEDKRAQAAKLAALVTQELDQLHGAPGDRPLAKKLRSEFEKQAIDAGELAK
ncbi:MAG: hypothetical protein ABI896_03385 [Actinomycetota bacterium]